MPSSSRRCIVAVAACLLFAGTQTAQADLYEYVKKAEPSYAWKLLSKNDTGTGTVYTLHLISQTWHDIKWEHDLQIFVPKDAKPAATMLLWNQGGKPNFTSQLLAMELAKRVQAPTAFLYGIPNQPLFDGKKEDALIAETYVRYLETRDETWPLLFPMVKSLVKAMDALQAFARDEWKHDIKNFVVTGASKRGWTTWLTGAVDPRVKAIAPLVIDTLNMRDQMEHQFKSFGGPSEMIKDYTERKLVPMPDTDAARKLWSMVDPYFYRDKLTMPKLIINGNNDPYWTTDALNLYWDGLKGDKWVLYVPNAGHNLQEKDTKGNADFSRTVNGLAAFARHQLKDNPMPKLSWKHDDAGDKLRLTVEAKPAPLASRLWVAQAPTRDFRKAVWTEQKTSLTKEQIVGEVERPKEGYVAFYAELDYEIDGIRHQLSTQLRLEGTARQPERK